jgi:hypothetical protein
MTQLVDIIGVAVLFMTFYGNDNGYVCEEDR